MLETNYGAGRVLTFVVSAKAATIPRDPGYGRAVDAFRSNESRWLWIMRSCSAVSACGEARSGAVRKNRVKRASKKQEGSGLAEVA
jgi:hypothetical protein